MKNLNFLKNPETVKGLSTGMDVIFAVLPMIASAVVFWVFIQFITTDKKQRDPHRKMLVISLAMFGYSLLLNWCFKFYVLSLGPEDSFTTIEWIKIFAIVLLPLIPIGYRIYLFEKTELKTTG
jgi:hypothetical protein